MCSSMLIEPGYMSSCPSMSCRTPPATVHDTFPSVARPERFRNWIFRHNLNDGALLDLSHVSCVSKQHWAHMPGNTIFACGSQAQVPGQKREGRTNYKTPKVFIFFIGHLDVPGTGTQSYAEGHAFLVSCHLHTSVLRHRQYALEKIRV
jgi:hypothetical protein